MQEIKKKLVPLAAAALFLLAGCGAEGDKTAPPQEAAAAPAAEDTLSVTFETQDAEGNSVTSDIFAQSKLTMVNVWATYCNPCLREMPGLGELAGEYDPEEFQLIGIVSDVQEGAEGESLALVQQLVEQTGAGYTHLLLNESLYNAMLTGVTAVPTTFFVDENGVILDTVVGSKEKAVWEDMVNALLAEL